MSNASDIRDKVEKMNEYREVQEHTRVIRDNAHELDDLVDEMRWVAAGGRGAVDPEKFDRLVRAIRLTAEDLEGMEIPDAYEVRECE